VTGFWQMRYKWNVCEVPLDLAHETSYYSIFSLNCSPFASSNIFNSDWGRWFSWPILLSSETLQQHTARQNPNTGGTWASGQPYEMSPEQSHPFDNDIKRNKHTA
jgi:hypothetical protein